MQVSSRPSWISRGLFTIEDCYRDVETVTSQVEIFGHASDGCVA